MNTSTLNSSDKNININNIIIKKALLQMLALHKKTFSQQFDELARADLQKNLLQKIIQINVAGSVFYIQSSVEGFEYLEPESYKAIEIDAAGQEVLINQQQAIKADLILNLILNNAKNNSLSYSGEDVWMNYLKIDGDIATAKHLQDHVKALNLTQEGVAYTLLQPFLEVIFKEKADLVFEKLVQEWHKCISIKKDFIASTVDFISKEREIVTTCTQFEAQKEAIYNLNNDIDRLGQRIQHLKTLL